MKTKKKKMSKKSTNNVLNITPTTNDKKEKELACLPCNRRFATERFLEIHLKGHRNCKVCGKDFTYQRDLDVHMFKHTTKRPFKCSTCPKTFKSDRHLRMHIRAYHESDENVPCPYCNKVLRRQNTVRSHLERMHPEKLPGYKKCDYECFTCHKTFISWLSLQQHTRMHAADKNYLCSICGLELFTADALEKHLMSKEHNPTGELKSKVCSYCPKRFRCSYTLKRHINVHTGEFV